MVRTFLDSSAYIKGFSKEKGSEATTKIINACEKGKLELVISQWSLGESLAAIDRKFRAGLMSQKEMSTTIASILKKSAELARSGRMFIVLTRPELVTASWSLVIKRHLSADDALQLFSSIVSLCEAFVAADQHLLEAARDEGFDGYNVENEEDCRRLIKRLKL